MLALSVREGDYVTIGDDIVVQVLKAGSVFRLAIDAPRSMAIERAKVRESSTPPPECIRRVRSQEALKGRNYRKTPSDEA